MSDNENKPSEIFTVHYTTFQNILALYTTSEVAPKLLVYFMESTLVN